MMTEGDLVTLPKGVEIDAFRPVAYYDSGMDMIRVVTHDRSVTEHRINESFTIHECNHRGPFDPQYVGFTIKGVRHLFHEIGLPVDGVYRLAEVIDRIVSHRPGSTMAETLKLVFREIQGTGDLEVDLRAA